jgi:two-component system NtrC family sensor kinase
VAVQKKYTSLRRILTFWFIIFSIVPLALVAIYSLVTFREAIENELFERLKSNGREVEVMFSEFYDKLKDNRDNFAGNPRFTYNLSVGDLAALNDDSAAWLSGNILTSIATYSRDGRRLSFAGKELTNNTRLNQRYIEHLASSTDIGVIEHGPQRLELSLISRIVNSKAKTIGYVEQRLVLGDSFLSKVKDELKLELMLLNIQNQVILSTIAGRPVIGKAKAEEKSLIDVQGDSDSFAFIEHSVIWDKSQFKVFIGTSKAEIQRILKKINVVFLGVTGLGVLFLIITIFISTRVLLKPVSKLIESLREFENTDSLVQVKVKNRTEIGLLMETFNQMSLKVFQTRNDLKNKIKELEQANINLKEAQAQLVQSAKMTSLGQLVAGVAHELNNPIGFIYSNTSHLKEYTSQLISIIEEIEKNPEFIEQIKQKHEFEYIRKDLPLLINSCLEGAQRTRDIVIGLRNFSRLEESQLKDIDLNDAIDMTLDFLKGEVKNRIKITRNFQELPPVYCYASQINQVLLNILSNAVHAISGSGNIWITTSFLPSDSAGDQKVRVSIKDSGEGMSADVVEKIFEPFFTTKEVGKGTGLGLSISYGIIQNHQGDIQVCSEKGVGTEFIITIPVKQNSKSARSHL